MKRALFLVACLLAAMPAAAQTSLLPTVQRLRAEYPARMSPGQVGELLNRVAWEHRFDGWGLLRKTGGSRCPAPHGGDISCDILIHAPSIRHFDVLADAEGAATPVWRDVGPCVLGPSSGCAMSNFLAPVRPAQARMTRTSGDFDGDGKTDLTVFRPSDGYWYSRGVSTYQWGSGADVPVPADYDGDGKTDHAIFRPSTGTWHIRYSRTGTALALAWGNSADRLVPADYDGDGSADIAVYRPLNGTWYIVNSRNWSVSAFAWGAPGVDIPVPGDYDGDGRTDAAVFRPTDLTFYILYANGSGTFTIRWDQALSTDVPLSADYDGDGRTDLALFRPSTGMWYIGYATGLYTAVQWGNSLDIPVPGDFDGDGRSDVAVFRPSDGTWYWIGSTAGVGSTQWGASTDVPVIRR